MRVCLVSREVAPFYGGGIGTYVDEMATALVNAGHEVHILTQAHEGLAERAPVERPNFRYHTVDFDAFPMNLNAFSCYAQRHAMGVYTALKDLHTEHPFDYIEMPDYWGDGYFALRAKALCDTFEDAVMGVRLHSPAWMLREDDIQPWITTESGICDHLEQTSVELADVIVSASRCILDRTIDRLAERLPGTTPRHILELPIHIDDLQRILGGVDGAAESCASVPGRKVVLFYGRLQHLKGVHVLVDAGLKMLARGENVEFHILGHDTQTGPLGKSLKEWVQKKIGPMWADRFIFEDRRPREELGPLIRACDVVCVPSLFESFSMVTVEAMAMGACVVGSRGSAIEEIIRDGQEGLLFDKGDADSLADALERALADDDLRTQLGAAAPGRIRELSEPTQIVRRLETIIDEARTVRADVRRTDDERRATITFPNDAPLVTVAIPYYNLGKYLPETIEYVQRQTFQDYEILVIDDGSTDAESLRVLDDLKATNVRVHRKPNGGLSSARNEGLKVSRSPYVLLLDADDLIHETYLERTVEAIQRDPNAAVACSLNLVFRQTPDEPHGGWIPLGIDHDLLPFLCIGGTASCLVDREKILSIGGYDERLPTGGEDWDIWLNCAQAGFTSMIIPEFLFYYRGRADGMFHTDVLPNINWIKAYLMMKYPDISERPDHALRLHIAEIEHYRRQNQNLQQTIGKLRRDLARTGVNGAVNGSHDPDVEVQRIIQENIRYRIADRVNNALKATKLQKPLKVITGKAIRSRQRR